MANNKAKSRWSYRTPMALALAVCCFPLFGLLFIWWLLRARWGFGTHMRADIRVLPSIEFSKMFDEGFPRVLIGIVTQWQAFRKWTPEYLRANLGNQTVKVFITPGNVMGAYVAQNYETLNFNDLIDVIFSKLPSKNLCYMMGHGLEHLEHLRHDLSIPYLSDGRLLDEAGTGLWIGHKGNFTSLHFDGWHGCLIQLRGRKRVKLFSPDDTCYLYQNSPFGMKPYVTRISGDSKDADPSQFPDLRHAHPVEWILKPGQLLYIPPYWWHEAESLDNSISFTIRYMPRRSESALRLLTTGNLLSTAWFFLVRRPLNRLFNY